MFQPSNKAHKMPLINVLVVFLIRFLLFPSLFFLSLSRSFFTSFCFTRFVFSFGPRTVAFFQRHLIAPAPERTRGGLEYFGPRGGTLQTLRNIFSLFLTFFIRLADSKIDFFFLILTVWNFFCNFFFDNFEITWSFFQFIKWK